MNTLSEKTIIVCSIVRNCATNLERNIKVINELCSLVKDFSIIVFENDSTDNTKEKLKEWQNKQKNTYISLNDYNVENTIPEKEKNSKVNPFFSRRRIEKMAFYRNKYLEVIKQENLTADYVVVVDLDVEKIEIKSIIDSFQYMDFWDCITANGYSISPRGSWRYHDTYALCEYEEQNEPQTEQKITDNQYKWSFMRRNMPFIKVFSAFGGIAIYKYEAIMSSQYDVLENDDPHVEVYCEHYALHRGMAMNSYKEICINPSMIVKYQKVTFKIIKEYILKKLKNIR